ncbi:MAG: class I SAM-dependent methyltransferase [Rhodospirillales bacterium]|jgi:SAM-dependent methyltransferase|nr:class I SAM-dependent methyltransferase [Rhodospirillales bacterium]MBT4626100.1 class I SAM-dependent methyltransferase [Rhodospirillales bacterium]MBT6109359.1 class I SAM-dependent methyltransferase [Rhodospirillales bacterium]MBT7777621.1 class I SAM-dependent methyltransferase [Rhodospirillales bacterium]
MNDDPLVERAFFWESKPVLRHIYGDLFQRMATHVTSGTTLEVGGGTGLGKIFLKNVISSDILAAPSLDLVSDCHILPFKDNSMGNIVMLDVLHHLDTPVLFLLEASRVLKKGGRLIMIEPAITPLSWLFYSLFHEEPVDMKASPFGELRPSEAKDPFEGNQAIPTLMFHRQLKRTLQAIPAFSVVQNEAISLWCYPLSGGFQTWSLLPVWLAPTLLRLERFIEPMLGRLIGFRMLTVLENTGNGSETHA